MAGTPAIHPVRERLWQWSRRPPAQALFLTLILLAIMLPYWWLAVQWSEAVLDPGQHDTFETTTFLLVLIIADSTFLIRYYQLMRQVELQDRARELHESQERLELALAGADLGTWNWDIVTGAVVFNRRWAEMIGYDLAEIEPHVSAWERLVHPDDMPRVRQVLAAHLEGKTDYYHCEHRLHHKNGSWVWVLDKGKVTRRDKDGRPLAAAGTHLDISDRVRIELELRESERKYRTIIENMQDMFYRTDLAGKITMVTPSGARLAGYDSPGDLIGRDVTTVYANPTDREKLLGILQEKGSVYAYPLALRHRDGTVRHVTTSSHLFRDPQGQVLGVEGVIHDISDQTRAENALRMANNKLNLLTGITRHDIRNQLMALGAFLELIGETSKSTTEKNDFDDFLAKAKKIVATIERQISFTKDYEDLGVNAPVWQDIGECVGKAMTGHVLGKIRVVIDTGDLEVYADPMLERVFYNLFDNALRYGGEGLSVIRIASRPAGTSCVLVIEDNGVGIPPEDKPQLFNKGFGRHTGLGLFLSREILAITGITIAETGTFGVGACFELTIPEGLFRFIKMEP